jgi:hypothetical protein
MYLAVTTFACVGPLLTGTVEDLWWKVNGVYAHKLLTPVRVVGIGLNSPRISAGASGFG